MMPTPADQRDGLPLPLIEGGQPRTPARQMKTTKLKRQVFTTSRELEYFSESELTTQTGYPKEQWWPGVVVKELLDNSLDACEQAGVAPVISVDFPGSVGRRQRQRPGYCERSSRQDPRFLHADQR